MAANTMSGTHGHLYDYLNYIKFVQGSSRYQNKNADLMN